MGSNDRIIIVGAGIVGLTTAVRLLERGLAVGVMADRHHPTTTGNLAAGMWYPYRVGGTRVAHWALASLAAYRELAPTPGTGVRIVRCTSFIQAGEPAPFWVDAEVDYRAPAPLTTRTNPEAETFQAWLPVASPSSFLPWLELRIAEMGGTLTLLDQPLENLEELPAEVVVNCTGLGARRLCGDDSVVPIRGVVVRLAGTGIEACVTDETDPDQPTYIIPNGDYCVLGGSAELNRWDVTVSKEEADDIVDRCARLDGRVRHGINLGAFAGLRPGRPEVRLESEIVDDGRVVVHNYGHGGSGFTLAWGCADEAAEIVTRLVS